MSSKSRRRGRRLSRSERRKVGRVVAAPVALESAAGKAAPAPRAAAPVSATRAPAAKTALAAPPDVSGELWRIGILAGIIAVILVVVYFVLS